MSAYVICQVCGEEEVNEPGLDWCGVCNLKLCDGCIAAYDRESGYRYCHACFEKLPKTDLDEES